MENNDNNKPLDPIIETFLKDGNVHISKNEAILVEALNKIIEINANEECVIVAREALKKAGLC